ncbi:MULTISPECIES: DUF3140 domain-containing protein [Streptomyces]|uniref:DUF3140 domain-containing protein n=1 Tax=Streptomyces TaxID=1883 RepID=UPI0002F700C6|nr:MULTISPECIES: DUF3140 domain-containing protein [Streptomyces]MCC3650445.1 DUF3140 domain-containing protein [Streptomyces sp. S07_1.15]WSQ74575.1 DUF3140 domain-containing protein [Streptomyces xinghaiensis]
MADTSAHISTIELDALWDEFHRVVNMNSEELAAWLRTESAGEVSETEPDHSGTELGRHVLHILQKRRTDLTDDDIRVMHKIVDRVTDQRREDMEPVAGQSSWRHRLMNMGHDPLKPPRDTGR